VPNLLLISYISVLLGGFLVVF